MDVIENNQNDISNYWLYSDLREIIILPNALSNLIQFMTDLDGTNDEKSIIVVLNKFTETCYSMQSSQRSKLVTFLIDKANLIITDASKKIHLKTIITTVYYMMASYRDQDRLNSEIKDLNTIIQKLIELIIDKISINRESEDFLIQFYIFVIVFIKQLSLWMELNGFKDEKLKLLQVPKFTKKKSDIAIKSLLIFNHQFSLPLEEITLKCNGSINHLIILSFYSFLCPENLNNDSKVNKIAIKRPMNTDLVKSAPKLSKHNEVNSEIKNKESINYTCEDLVKIIVSYEEQIELEDSILIDMFKKTPEIIIIAGNKQKNDDIDSNLSELIFVNLVRLWTHGLKKNKKLVTQLEYNLYYWPLVCNNFKLGNFKLQIRTLLDFIMEFQSKLIHDILSNPSWILNLINNFLELIINNSTNDKNLNDNETKEIVDLIGQIGKVLEVLLRPKNLKSLCRVVVIIPHRLFSHISELKSALYPKVKRTLGKNIVSPIITVLNKHTLGYLKMDLKGAAREVCRDFLEIK